VRGSEKAQVTSDGCSRTSSELFARYDRNGSLWKMSAVCSQSTLEGPLQKYSEAWPRSGTMLHGKLYRPRNAEPRTDGNGYSYWLTPTLDLINQRRGKFAQGGDQLTHQVDNWPTPIAQDSDQATHQKEKDVSLTTKAQDWPTPTGSMMTPEDMEQAKYAGNSNKRPEYKDVTWPTPTSDRHGPESKASKDKRGSGGIDLQTTAKDWPTASSRDWKDTSGMAFEGTNPDGSMRDRTDQLGRRVHATMRAGNLSSRSTRSLRRRLNPMFVEWLMGFPENWSLPYGRTVSGCSETQSSQSRQPQPSSGSTGG